MDNRFHYGKIIGFTVLVLIALLGAIGVSLAADELIVYLGVGSYRIISSVVKIVCGAFAAADAVTIA